MPCRIIFLYLVSVSLCVKVSSDNGILKNLRLKPRILIYQTWAIDREVFWERTQVPWLKTILQTTLFIPQNLAYITIVFDFSWNDCNAQEKWKTMVMQIGCKRGQLWSMWKWWIKLSNKITALFQPCPRTFPFSRPLTVGGIVKVFSTNWAGHCISVSYRRRERLFYSAWWSEPRKYRAVCRANEIPSSLVILRPWV